MNTVIDVASVVVFIVLIMYAAIKLDEAAKNCAARKSGFTGRGEKNETGI